MIYELEPKLEKLKKEIKKLELSKKESDKLLLEQCKRNYYDILKGCYKNLSPVDRVYLARHINRPNIYSYIENIFDDFIELQGDRICSDDKSILGGIALFNNIPVTIIGHKKGHTLEENVLCNFGMPNPSGYRKVQRLAKQAEKFSRPIITFIDTPGAYPGIEAEKQGQGEAIASCLSLFSDIKVPVIAVIIGEGGSGGALALGVANKVIMLENAVYSVLSPEGFASILWKDSARKAEACEVMKLTANDLKKLNIIDYVISEGVGSIIENKNTVMKDIKDILEKELIELNELNEDLLLSQRYDKFRVMGSVCTKGEIV